MELKPRVEKESQEEQKKNGAGGFGPRVSNLQLATKMKEQKNGFFGRMGDSSMV